MNKDIKILLVEDEIIIAMSLEMELSQGGYRVCKIVSSGEDAVASVKQENPNVILMDIGLSGKMNGIEAALQIRGSHDIPIIFMTGYQESVILEQTAAMASTALLHKPLNIREVSAAIDSFNVTN